MAWSNPFSTGQRQIAGGIAGGAALAPLFSSSPKFKNPADAAMPWLNQVPGQVSPYYKPYIERGEHAGSALEGEYGQMTNDPGGLYSHLGQGYKESPGYQFKLKQAMMAGDNAAAAGGMAGSLQHQQQNETVANGLASDDFRQYMDQILGEYNQGIHGQEDMLGQGYNASNELGQTIGNNLNSKADVASRGVDQENQYNQAKAQTQGQKWGNLAGTAALAAFR